MVNKIAVSSKVFALVLIGVVGLIIYSNSFHVPFVFDDESFIVRNFHIADISNVKEIWRAYIVPTRFISFYTFALNYHFHQFDVVGYHVVNVAVHLINAGLVYHLGLLLFATPVLSTDARRRRKHSIALAAAMIFLCHPLQTQAVIYISQRFASLATLFYLGSVCLYLKARLEGNDQSRRRVFVIGSFVTGLLGMFTKEIVFTLPFAILLIEGCFFHHHVENIRKYLLKYAIFFAAGFVSLLIIPALFSFNFQRIFFSETLSGSHEGEVLSPLTYFLTQPRVILTYVKLLFVPLGQNLDYDFPASRSLAEPYTLLSWLTLMIIVVLACKFFARHRLLAFGIFWFFLTLLVESSIVLIPNVIFEHRVYLPMVGFSFFLVGGLDELLKEERRFTAVTVGIVIVLSGLTWQRNKIWQSPLSLWHDVVAKSPLKSRGHENLALAYSEVGQWDQAARSLHKALELNPNNYQTYHNLATIYIHHQQYDLALENAQKAIAMHPDYIPAYNNLGIVLMAQDQLDEAQRVFLQILAWNPFFPEARLNLSRLYQRQGRIDEAIQACKENLKIDPLHVPTIYHLLELYLISDHQQEALDFSKDLLTKDFNGGHYVSLAQLWSRDKEFGIALDFYEKALRIDAGNKDVYFDLGAIQWNLGLIPEAIKMWEQGQKIAPGDERFAAALAKAREAGGRPKD